ncbi:MAG TPA: protein-L-isoaspartate(D-aspartate) O-methyltransferase [Vicinamibacterales bacterium]|nr:protein-L-isoaspartate(D-aspartate) O-methyltransferase [Vicinamibacterales bacterium]
MARMAGAGVVLMAGLMACAGEDRANPANGQPPAWSEARRRMIDEQLRSRGIRDERVLAAMGEVPRHLFVPPADQASAYADTPLPIGHGQTISQPYIVGFMTEALQLEPSHKVLEIGTGSGYQAAILGRLAGQVYTIELVPELAERARRTLSEQEFRNVHVRAGDGYQGWPEHAPFDRIMVTAAPEEVPQALVDQLAPGGRMVVPVGPRFGDQELRILTKTPKGVMTERSLPVRFVPMIKK